MAGRSLNRQWHSQLLAAILALAACSDSSDSTEPDSHVPPLGRYAFSGAWSVHEATGIVEIASATWDAVRYTWTLTAWSVYPGWDTRDTVRGGGESTWDPVHEHWLLNPPPIQLTGGNYYVKPYMKREGSSYRCYGHGVTGGVQVETPMECQWTYQGQ